jgi:hypothetical protein
MSGGADVSVIVYPWELYSSGTSLRVRLRSTVAAARLPDDQGVALHQMTEGDHRAITVVLVGRGTAADHRHALIATGGRTRGPTEWDLTFWWPAEVQHDYDAFLSWPLMQLWLPLPFGSLPEAP